MVVRREKKVRKQRGSRTYGRGCAKRGRGSGEKGGRGMAGGHKHKWSYILRYMPDYFGKHGFVRPNKPERKETINVGELDERVEDLLKEGVATREGEKIIVDVSKLGVQKVLGAGQVRHPLVIKGAEVVPSAREKLERAGGGVVGGGEAQV
jgi:large subunit ribosomal protein L15